MVHANELRLGNKLWLCKPAETQPYVITVTGFTVTENVMHLHSAEEPTLDITKGFRPITITTDVLEKCGFTKDEIEYIGSLWHLHPIQLLDDNGLWLVNDKLRKRIKVTSLHQLQNLYFALSGKELEVTL